MNPFDKIVKWYLKKEALPYWCMVLMDAAILFLSGLLAYWIENRSLVLLENRHEVLYTLLLITALGLVSARLFKTYCAVIRYSTFTDLLKVGYASSLTLFFAIIVTWLCRRSGSTLFCALSLTMLTITYLTSTMGMWLVRCIIKVLYEVSHKNAMMKPVLIYGSLTSVTGLAKNIRAQQVRRYNMRGFIVPGKTSKNIRLMGREVFGAGDDIARVVKEFGVKGVLVTLENAADFRADQQLQDVLIGAGCKIYMMQQVREANVMDGKLSQEDLNGVYLKEVQVEDLLPRSEIRVDLKSVGEKLAGRRVLITGAAGSIGSEIVRQVAQFNPGSMVLIDQAETPEHDIRLMMARRYPHVNAETIVTSICNEDRMESIFKNFRPEYVFHAAAYKHVPMMEDNPSEAVRNNVFGTKVVADLSVKYGVKRFVMISTDKAVNPTNVMGCSKRICEIYVQSLNRKLEMKKLHNDGEAAYPTQFVTTRFGNVLGSNGSVIPLFKEQIKKGGPVTVTDERIVRFFMLIPEACKLVLEAGTKGKGGEIFVFDMGRPVKIADLAKRMIALSGAKDIEIKYTGLREGEKLYEEVLNELEGTKPTFHEKIRIAEVREFDYDYVNASVKELIEISKKYDDMATVRKMKEIVPEYKSNNSKYEQLDHEQKVPVKDVVLEMK